MARTLLDRIPSRSPLAEHEPNPLCTKFYLHIDIYIGMYIWNCRCRLCAAPNVACIYTREEIPIYVMQPLAFAIPPALAHVNLYIGIYWVVNIIPSVYYIYIQVRRIAVRIFPECVSPHRMLQKLYSLVVCSSAVTLNWYAYEVTFRTNANMKHQNYT